MIAIAVLCLANMAATPEIADPCFESLTLRGGSPTIQSHTASLIANGGRTMISSVTTIRNGAMAGDLFVSFKDPTGKSQNGGGARIEILWNGSPVSYVARDISDLRGHRLYQLDTSNVGPIERYGIYTLRIDYDAR